MTEKTPCNCGKTHGRSTATTAKALAQWIQAGRKAMLTTSASSGLLLPDAPEPPLGDDGEPDQEITCDDNPEVAQIDVWAPAYLKWCQCEAAFILCGDLLSEYEPLADDYSACRGMVA